VLTVQVALGAQFPDKLTLGIEIRPKVVEYVEDRIQKLREKNKETTTGLDDLS
jgi:tRNA G46 methylase TrmB